MSPRQLEALQFLRSRGESFRWVRPGVHGIRTNTLESLVRLGLVESRIVYPKLIWEYRALPSS